MKIFEAFKIGIGNVYKSKRYLFFAYAINFLLVIIITFSIAATLKESLGKSASGEKLLENFDEFWFLNFSALAKGLAKTFDPSITGIGAIFNSMDTVLSGSLFNVSPLISGAGSLYLLVWVFLTGGFLSIFISKDENVSFFQSSGRYFPRLLIVSIMSWILYIIIFKFLFTFLSWTVNDLTRENIDERVHFIYTLIKYLILWLVVLSVNIIFDYSKILIVMNNYRNAFSVPWFAIRLVFKNFLKIYGLYILIGVVWILFILIYWLIAPGAAQSSWTTIFIAFLVGQIYIFSRIWIRCLFISAQSELGVALIEKPSKN